MFVVFVILQEEVLGTLLRPFGAEVPEILRSARSGTSVRKTSAAFTSVLSREKPFVSLKESTILFLLFYITLHL